MVSERLVPREVRSRPSHLKRYQKMVRAAASGSIRVMGVRVHAIGQGSGQNLAHGIPVSASTVGKWRKTPEFKRAVAEERRRLKRLIAKGGILPKEGVKK